MMPVLRRVAPLGLAVLFALAVLGLLVEAGSVPHVHVADGPAVFNLDHDLSYLATLGGATPPPEGPAPIPLAATSVVETPGPQATSRPPGGHVLPRAPPA